MRHHDGMHAAATVVVPTFRSADYWVSFALFVCALLSKTVTATLPAALLVVLWWQRGRLDWRRDVLPLVPWFAVAAIAGAFTIWFEHDIIGARGADFTLSVVERLLLAGRVVWFYLGKLFWPAGLNFIYPRWTIDASVAWQYLFSIAAVALAVALGVLARPHPAFAPSSQTAAAGRRGPLAGYLFFVGTLVPVLGFVNVYPFLFSYVADHFQYLASLGVIVPVASVLVLSSARLGVALQRVLADGASCDAWDADVESQRCFRGCRDAVSRRDRAESAGLDGIPESRHRAGRAGIA